MRHRIVLGLAVMLATAGAALAQEPPEPPHTRLVLQETASREVEQDTLVAVLTARAEATAPRDAQAQVNRAMTAAIEQARASEGVRAATGGYRVYQQHDAKGRPSGWIAEQDLRLIAKESATLLELAGRLQDEGLLLSGLGYELSREARRELETELTVEAIGRLQARAERVAEALAKQVLRIETMRIGGAMGEPPVRPMMMARMTESDAMPPPSALPDLEVVNVSVEAEVLLAPR